MIEKLKELCQKNGIPLGDSDLELFERYMNLLSKWNKVYNLTSIRKKEEIITKHFFDSLTLIKLFEHIKLDVKGKEIADLGSGGGFPGVPLKIFFKDTVEMFLIEAVNKKCIFLEMLKRELSIDYTVICKRSEEINKKFDIVLSRATGETFDVLKWGKDILKKDGYLIIMKGKKVEEELREYTVTLKFKGYMERKFIVIKKLNEYSHKF
ncbi:16S rRNA (guanine(527)-N(7))-methyltransferase RsmG [Persephonella sp.]